MKSLEKQRKLNVLGLVLLCFGSGPWPSHAVLAKRLKKGRLEPEIPSELTFPWCFHMFFPCFSYRERPV